jgi:hypothetical protein
MKSGFADVKVERNPFPYYPYSFKEYPEQTNIQLRVGVICIKINYMTLIKSIKSFIVSVREIAYTKQVFILSTTNTSVLQDE